MHYGTPTSAFSSYANKQPVSDQAGGIDTDDTRSLSPTSFGGGWGGGGLAGGGSGGGFGGGLPMSSPRGGGGGAGMGGIPNDGFGGIDNPSAIADIQRYRGMSGEWSSGPALAFAEGGAIDEASGDVNVGGMGGNFSAQLAQAVKACRDVLDHGRQKYGLGQEKEQQEAANRIPVSPGTQSESGMPKEQPMPGQLPPTKNPFGKRADAGEEAIPTDDEQEQA